MVTVSSAANSAAFVLAGSPLSARQPTTMSRSVSMPWRRSSSPQIGRAPTSRSRMMRAASTSVWSVRMHVTSGDIRSRAVVIVFSSFVLRNVLRKSVGQGVLHPVDQGCEGANGELGARRTGHRWVRMRGRKQLRGPQPTTHRRAVLRATRAEHLGELQRLFALRMQQDGLSERGELLKELDGVRVQSFKLRQHLVGRLLLAVAIVRDLAARVGAAHRPQDELFRCLVNGQELPQLVEQVP